VRLRLFVELEHAGDRLTDESADQERAEEEREAVLEEEPAH
jgi:hypothetical protein